MKGLPRPKTTKLKLPKPKQKKQKPSPPLGKIRTIPVWDDSVVVEDTPENRALYGKHLDTYSSLPLATRNKMLRMATTGKLIDLSLDDLRTPDSARKQITGETAAWIEERRRKLGPDATPLQIWQIAMTAPDVPWSILFPITLAAAPYVHAKKVPAFDPNERSAESLAATLREMIKATEPDV